MSIFNTNIENLVNVTSQLLASIRVKANKNTIKKFLETHPYSDSLLAISDCLKELRVNSQSYLVNKETNDSFDIPFPFITYFSECEGKFVLVHSADKNEVIISERMNKYKTLSRDEFIQLWEGIVLIAEANRDSGETNYCLHRFYHYLRHSTLVMIILAICLFMLTKAFEIPILLLLVIKFVGIAITVLLLSYDINKDNILLKNICGTNNKGGCKDILSSKRAALTSWLKWSELGFYYFTGSFFALLFFPGFTPVLSLINIAALPSTLYSIFYQLKEKNWCILCCTIHGLILLERLTYYWISGTLSIYSTVNQIQWFFVFVSFLFPILIWNIQKPILFAAINASSLNKELTHFKYDIEIFTHLLRKQQYYQIDDELMPVIIGNANARIVITRIGDPFCRPCAEAHQFIDKWLQQTEKVQIKLLFYFDDQQNSYRNLVAYHLIALGVLNDKNVVLQALSDWYNSSNKNYENWATRYPVAPTASVYVAGFKQKSWREKTGIILTPTILVNGYKLPEQYNLEDLPKLIDLT